MSVFVIHALQVLELGIVVHSVIIGISLGVSEEPGHIKPLVVAISFHQMFEGMGLGGCIVQVYAIQALKNILLSSIVVSTYINPLCPIYV
jgi:hypothetical protein